MLLLDLSASILIQSYSLKTSRYDLADIPRDEHGGMTIVIVWDDKIEIFHSPCQYCCV